MRGNLECATVCTLTRDPERRMVKNGELAMITFSAVVGAKDDPEPQWLKVAAFGQIAEDVFPRLAKGSKVYLEGRLKLSRWQSADGEQRSGLEIVANKIKPLYQIGRNKPKPTPARRADPQAPIEPGMAGAFDPAVGDEIGF